ncbi:MAG: hypothetical protein RL205_1737, partial [Actinomycetota bacterium]
MSTANPTSATKRPLSQVLLRRAAIAIALVLLMLVPGFAMMAATG